MVNSPTTLASISTETLLAEAREFAPERTLSGLAKDHNHIHRLSRWCGRLSSSYRCRGYRSGCADFAWQPC